MTTVAELDRRVTKLELEMVEVRGLAKHARREADLHNRLRELRSEVREGVTNLEERFAQFEDEVWRGLVKVSVGMAQISTMLRITIDLPEQPDES
jgi:hypothetical protein